MKPGRSPQLLALLSGGSVALLLVPLLLFLPTSLRLYLVPPITAGLVFCLVWFIFHVTVYRRLRRIDSMVRDRARLPGTQLELLAMDPIGRIQKTLRDLIHLNHRELRHMREMENFRREFIGDVSHELKTPLFSIQGFLETLLDGAMDDPNVNRKFLKKAIKNVERLNSLVQDLLIISQLETGELRMNRESFRIYDLVLDVVDLLDHKLTSKGRHIAVAIHTNGLEGQQVWADKERMQQVLFNLLDNAITYGRPDGHITIELAAEENKVYVRVKDEGPGIAEEHLPHLFGRFYRIDKSRSREGGGTGLGLAIVKNLLEAHGERVGVSSEPGKGSIFEFSIQKTPSNGV